MKIIFADINSDVTDALKIYFAECPDIYVHNEDIFKHKSDAIVSPANSFGFMDGGIDYAYSKHFGWDLQKRLQEKINTYYKGELLVGEATWVPTMNKDIPMLISAPTMRVPADISNTVNVYLSFKAALHKAKKYNVNILSPGFGTCTGNVNPFIAAYQMRIAYEEVINNKTTKYTSLMQALNFDKLLKGKANA